MANFTFSDTVIIVICGSGVALIIAAVLVLILCITSKKKDQVETIRPRRRRLSQVHAQAIETRQRRGEMPKPPPYSEFPPDYNDWPTHDIMNTEIAENHRSTTRGVNVSVHRTNSIRTRHGSPHPSASARSRLDREQYGVPAHARANETGARSSRPHAETSAHRGTRRNNNSQVLDGYSRQDEFSESVAHTQPTNNAINLNPITASYNSSYSGRGLVTNPRSDILPGEIGFGESPPPHNTAAATRREQRRQAINTIQTRRFQMSPSPPPAYQHTMV